MKDRTPRVELGFAARNIVGHSTSYSPPWNSLRDLSVLRVSTPPELRYGNNMMHDELAISTGLPADFNLPLVGSMANTATFLPGKLAQMSHSPPAVIARFCDLAQTRLDADEGQLAVVGNRVRRDAVVTAIRTVQELAVGCDLQVGTVTCFGKVAGQRRDCLLLGECPGVGVHVEHGHRVEQLVDHVEQLTVRMNVRSRGPAPAGVLANGGSLATSVDLLASSL